MLRSFALLLILAGVAWSGPNNPGPQSPTLLHSAQALDNTAPVTGSSAYPIGLDEEVTVEYQVSGLDALGTVTFTPLYVLPGSGGPSYPVEEETASGAVTLTEGTNDLVGVFRLDTPPGPRDLYIRLDTNDANGIVVTLRVIGW